VLLERIFEDVEVQVLIEVAEERLAEMVTFGDDDGILVVLRLSRVAKVGPNIGCVDTIPETTLFVEPSSVPSSQRQCR
jgi:hypothetical protein